MHIKEHINNILKIFKKDLKSATSNPIVIFGLVAIMILPSLYSLVNIQACWDPYEKTDNLEFAIVNDDMGALYNGETLNVGNELEDELRNNTKFRWRFVSREEAESGVRTGKYIAAIIIPSEFSKNLTSLDSSNPQTATMRYIVNDKNPVSSRMSDVAATQIQRELSSKIVEKIDVKVADKLATLQAALSSGASQLSSGASQVNAGANKISASSSQVRNGADQISASSSQVTSGAKQVTTGASQVNAGAKQVTTGASQVSENAEKLKKSVDIKTVPEPLKPVVQGSLDLADGSGSVAKGSSDVATGSSKLASSSAKLADGSVKLADGSVQLADGSVKLADGSIVLASGSSKLANSAANGFSTVAGSLDDITSIDRDNLGNFFYSPVKLKTEEIFPVDCYGSEVAPFYLVLSIWVGCIISCVMLKMKYEDESKFTPLEYYFGKQALFLVMALGQCTVTTVGSLILGFQINNIPLFIFSMYIISIIFMFIIYSISSVFGQLGKALMLIILVLQISGSGGVYPVGVMHPFFQFIYPLLPMTHGIAMLKEACLGLVVENYLWSFAKLLVFPIIVFILSVLIKEKMDKSANYFEEKLKETGIF